MSYKNPAKAREYAKKWYFKNIEKIKIYRKKRIEKRREYDKIYAYKNKEHIAKKRKEYRRKNKARLSDLRYKYYKENRTVLLANMKIRGKKRHRELRNKILIHYGGNPPKCACCKENYIEFLGVDHINGDGAKERKEFKRRGVNFYRYLIKNNYPKGYRILCHNCNMSFGLYGYCPHQKR